MEPLNCQPFLDRITKLFVETGIIKKFSRMKTFKEKLKLCSNYEIDDYFEALESASDKHQKCPETSSKLKEQGTKAFVKRKDAEAMRLYSKALRYVPRNSPILPLLYANRSAVHFEMKNYKDCLNDIDRAEKLHYPKESIHKLWRRKAICLANFGKTSKSLETLRDAEEAVLEMGTDCQDKYLSPIRTLLVELPNLKIQKEPPDERCNDLPSLWKGESEQVACMSSSLLLKKNNLEGRHIIAKEKLPKGSLVLAEKPFAFVLQRDFITSHCQHCLTEAINAIPCDNCVDIVWCSEICKEAGHYYHEYECKNLHILMCVGIAHLALRVLLIAGWNTCLKVRDESLSSKEADPVEVFNSHENKFSSYKAVFSLLTHLEDSAPEDQVQYCLASLILSRTLKHQDSFFGEVAAVSSPNRKSELLIELASFLVHHIAQLVSNGHAVVQHICSKGDSGAFQQVDEVRIAAAIYPSASLLNHSCKPSIINSFQNDVLLIHSVEDLEATQQLYNCYGPHFGRHERKERRTNLKQQYFFDCNCPPCTEKEYLVREASWDGLQCPSCNGISLWDEPKAAGTALKYLRCLECCKTQVCPDSVLQNLSNIPTLVVLSRECFSKGDFPGAVSNSERAVELGSRIYSEQNGHYNLIRDQLSKLYVLNGQFRNGLYHLFRNLNVVESRYGAHSVEVAQELLKRLDVLHCVVQTDASYDSLMCQTKKKIDQLFTLHYGQHWRNYLKVDQNYDPIK